MIDAAQEVDAVPAEMTNPLTGGSVLIVEDDRVFGQRLGKAFVERGFDVRVCATVHEAMIIVSTVHLDVVITDLRPGLRSGLAVVEAVKRISDDTKTLVLTGYGNVSSAVTAVKLGANDVLSKPADADEILEVLGLTDRSTSPPSYALKDPDLVQWEHIISVFEGTGKNVSKSARLLNMHRRTLQRMLTRGRPEFEATEHQGLNKPRGIKMRGLQLIEDRRIEMTEMPEPDAPSFGEVTVAIEAVALNHLTLEWIPRGVRQDRDARVRDTERPVPLSAKN